MKRFIRIFFAIGAVMVLTGYFFGDLVMTEASEPMSWEEFSANSAAVARLQERHESTGGSGHDLRQLYEKSMANHRSTQRLAAAGNLVGGDVAAFKNFWHRIYDRLTPRRGPLARGTLRIGHWLVIPVEVVGMTVTLAILVGTAIGTTMLISKLERTARRVRQ